MAHEHLVTADAGAFELEDIHGLVSVSGFGSATNADLLQAELEKLYDLLLEKAKTAGGNGVCGVRIVYAPAAGGSMLMTVYGTAVTAEADDESSEESSEEQPAGDA